MSNMMVNGQSSGVHPTIRKYRKWYLVDVLTGKIINGTNYGSDINK